MYKIVHISKPRDGRKYRIVKLFKTVPNENYTGVIHMAQYINIDNEKETGIIFFTQMFNDEDEDLNCGSFISDQEYMGCLDDNFINEEFGVKVHKSLEPGELAFFIDIGKDRMYLYDHDLFIGTYTHGDSIDFKNDQIDPKVFDDMFRNFNRIKKVVLDGSFQEKYQAVDDLHSQAESLRKTADSIDERVVFMKKNNRSDFNRKMNEE